jgi:hypothetical protein
MAFPPLGEAISEEEVGPEFICPCGSGQTFHQCCKGRKPKTGIPEEDEADRPRVPRHFFRVGSPKWVEQGVDRGAPDSGALEKARRSLLHRVRRREPL